jgi:hypothetical protein
MVQTVVRLDIPFDALVSALARLDVREKRLLLNVLEAELAQIEEDA